MLREMKVGNTVSEEGPVADLRCYLEKGFKVRNSVLGNDTACRQLSANFSVIGACDVGVLVLGTTAYANVRGWQHHCKTTGNQISLCI